MIAEIYSGSLLKNLHNTFKRSNRSNYVIIALIIGLSTYTLYKYINERKEKKEN
jgi:hypothetical protein